jgi:hypothetical protein
VRKIRVSLAFVAIAIVLAVTLPLSIKAKDDDQLYAGLGVSDANIVGFVNITETRQFEVGRIYNTGDFNMAVTSTWVPDGNYTGINIEIIPSEVYLKPDDARTIYAKVTGLAVGNYSGKISFSCNVHLPPNYHGNPSVPAGQANARFIVLEKPIVASQPFPKLIPIATTAIILATCVTFFGAWVIYKKHRVKKI